MGVSTKPSDDAKAMTDEYVKGVSINDIALKYNHSEYEVEQIVTKQPTDDEPVVTQTDKANDPPAEDKKAK